MNFLHTLTSPLTTLLGEDMLSALFYYFKTRSFEKNLRTILNNNILAEMPQYCTRSQFVTDSTNPTSFKAKLSNNKLSNKLIQYGTKLSTILTSFKAKLSTILTSFKAKLSSYVYNSI